MNDCAGRETAVGPTPPPARTDRPWALASAVTMCAALLLVSCATPGVQAEPSTHAHPTPSTEATRSPRSPSVRPTSEPEVTVRIRDNSYGEPHMTVEVGDVLFVNEDDVPHTVTEGQDGVAKVDARVNVAIQPGMSAVVTFAERGAYLITCVFHPEMSLLVHVE
jgi:plastocyanin